MIRLEKEEMQKKYCKENGPMQSFNDISKNAYYYIICNFNIFPSDSTLT